MAAPCSPYSPLGFSDAGAAGKLGVSVSATQVRSSGAQPAELGRLPDDGTIRVAIDTLADARQARERADRGHIQGKIVLTVR